MGSPVSAVVANLYMEFFEGVTLNQLQLNLYLWKRYVDDTIPIRYQYSCAIEMVNVNAVFIRKLNMQGTLTNSFNKKL